MVKKIKYITLVILSMFTTLFTFSVVNPLVVSAGTIDRNLSNAKYSFTFGTLINNDPTYDYYNAGNTNFSKNELFFVDVVVSFDTLRSGQIGITRPNISSPYVTTDCYIKSDTVSNNTKIHVFSFDNVQQIKIRFYYSWNVLTSSSVSGFNVNNWFYGSSTILNSLFKSFTDATFTDNIDITDIDKQLTDVNNSLVSINDHIANLVIDSSFVDLSVIENLLNSNNLYLSNLKDKFDSFSNDNINVLNNLYNLYSNYYNYYDSLLNTINDNITYSNLLQLCNLSQFYITKNKVDYSNTLSNSFHNSHEYLLISNYTVSDKFYIININNLLKDSLNYIYFIGKSGNIYRYKYMLNSNNKIIVDTELYNNGSYNSVANTYRYLLTNDNYFYEIVSNKTNVDKLKEQTEILRDLHDTENAIQDSVVRNMNNAFENIDNSKSIIDSGLSNSSLVNSLNFVKVSIEYIFDSSSIISFVTIFPLVIAIALVLIGRL